VKSRVGLHNVFNSGRMSALNF